MLSTKPTVEISDEACVGCTRCVKVCPSDALAMNDRLAVVTEDRCVGCFKCIEACIPYDAISVKLDSETKVLSIADELQHADGVEQLCAAARLDPEQAICLCTGTTAREVAASIVAGVGVPEDLTLANGVRARCGMWCVAPVMRLLHEHGIDIDRPAKDIRIYGDGDGVQVAIWTVPDEVADKYPEYRIRESLAAIEQGRMTDATPLFPDILPRSDT